MRNEPWKNFVESELQRAEEARSEGNEGQARVCARRAAGGMIRQYLQRKGIAADEMSAYEIIEVMREESQLPAATRDVLDHLVQRVDEGGKLPDGIDLIAETRTLMTALDLE